MLRKIREKKLKQILQITCRSIGRREMKFRRVSEMIASRPSIRAGEFITTSTHSHNDYVSFTFHANTARKTIILFVDDPLPNYHFQPL